MTRSTARDSRAMNSRYNGTCRPWGIPAQLSGLEDVVFNDFIKDDFIPEGDGQVASGSVSLPDPVVLETEEQMLEREQSEHDVLDTLGEYKYDAGMPVEDVSVIVNVKSVEKKSVAGQFAVKQV